MNIDSQAVNEEPNLFSMGKAAGAAVQDLITQHWPEIEAIILTTHKKQSVGLTLTFTPIADQQFKLKTAIRFAEKHSDEREDTVGGDPKQTRLPGVDTGKITRSQLQGKATE